MTLSPAALADALDAAHVHALAGEVRRYAASPRTLELATDVLAIAQADPDLSAPACAAGTCPGPAQLPLPSLETARALTATPGLSNLAYAQAQLVELLADLERVDPIDGPGLAASARAAIATRLDPQERLEAVQVTTMTVLDAIDVATDRAAV
jgi:hypothetical protein